MITMILIIMSFVIAFMLMIMICDPSVKLENDKSGPFCWVALFGNIMLLGSHLALYFHMYGTMLMYFFDLVLVIIIEIIVQAGKKKQYLYKKGEKFIEQEKAIKNHPA